MKYSKKEVLELLKKAREEDEYPDLMGAELQYQNLRGLDLSGADLEGANLYQTDLRYSDLSGAAPSEAILRFAKGVVAVVGIGSRNDTLIAWRKNDGEGGHKYIFAAGCFEGDEKEFRKAISAKLRLLGSAYEADAKAYRAAIPLLKQLLDLQYERR